MEAHDLQKEGEMIRRLGRKFAENDGRLAVGNCTHMWPGESADESPTGGCDSRQSSLGNKKALRMHRDG